MGSCRENHKKGLIRMNGLTWMPLRVNAEMFVEFLQQKAVFLWIMSIKTDGIADSYVR